MKTKISEFIRAASNLTDDNIKVFSDFTQSNRFKIPSPPDAENKEIWWDRTRKGPIKENDYSYDRFFTRFITKHVNLSRVSEKKIHKFFKDNDHIDPKLYVLKRMKDKDDETIAFVSERINRAKIGEILDKLEVPTRPLVYKKSKSCRDYLILENPGTHSYNRDQYGVAFRGEMATFVSANTEIGILVFLNYTELHPEKIGVRLIERFYGLFPDILSSSFFINILLDRVDFSSINIDFSDLDHYQKVALMKKKMKINGDSARTIFTMGDVNFGGFYPLYLHMGEKGVTYETLKENGLFEEFIRSDFGDYCNKKIIEDIHNE